MEDCEPGEPENKEETNSQSEKIVSKLPSLSNEKSYEIDDWVVVLYDIWYIGQIVNENPLTVKFVERLSANR